MSDAATFVHQLFGTPGGPATAGEDLLGQAAAAHAELFARASVAADPAVARSLAPIRGYLAGPAPAAEKRRLLDHPLFVEGLHGLAGLSPELKRWHDLVTAPPADGPCAVADPVAATALGNVSLAVQLRADPQWRGDLNLCTDVLGRVGFPFSDWTLALRTDHGEPLAGSTVTVAVGHSRACWRLGGEGGRPFLVLSRPDLLRLVAGAAGELELRRLAFPDPSVRPRLQRACPIRNSPIRYDPVGIAAGTSHAGMTGGIVECLLAAVRRNSPAVYRELAAYVHTVRGFEFPPSTSGVVGSFSDPTLPGVLGFSVSYTTRDEPRLDPLCFTWLGHEMGHTKDYLCDTVLYGQGQELLCNAAERTGPIPRYGRPLSLRTVFQVPYVHLYEWALLMDFWEREFRGLPWDVTADVAAAGDDLAAEIREAFELIDERARLTPLGDAAVAHFRDLYVRAQKRWRAIRARGRN